MKKITRIFLLYVFTLIIYSHLLSNLHFVNPIETIALVSLILTLFEIILKPIIKILLLPITILTLGLIRTVIDTLGLYMAVFLLNNFTVSNLYFAQTSIQGIIIPEISLRGFWSFFVTSTLISLIFHLFHKILIIKIQK